MVKARTQAINQLQAVIITTDPQLPETWTGLSHAALIRRYASLPDIAPTVVATAARHTQRRARCQDPLRHRSHPQSR